MSPPSTPPSDIPPVDADAAAAVSPTLRPYDDYNRKLHEQTHPSTWQNPTPEGRYNLVVVGAGTAGLVTAAGAAGLGAKVALIERSLMGGDCLNVGCVPSKAIIRSARAVHDVRQAASFGVEAGEPRVDFAKVMERMRQIRADTSPHDSAERFRDLGVDVYLGGGRFVGPDAIEVAGQRLTFSRAVIATGTRAVAPPIEGLAEAGYLTNETIFSLTELPRRLAVIGGGPIGSELAQAFARLGSQVTLIEAGERILPHDDADAAAIVQAAIERDGVDILCGGKTLSVRGDGEAKVLQVECRGEQRTVAVDEILVGAGRQPNVDDLGLEAAGVDFDDRKGITVNDYMQTSNPQIYGAGDVASPHRFTHAADALARLVIQNALFFGRAKASDLVMPWCTYTDPELAHVGLQPHEAEQRGLAVQTVPVDLADVDRARLEGETEGLLRVHLKKGTDRILGATLVARQAGEMISEITATMVAGRGLGTLAKTIHPYPTQAEIIKKAADAYNRTRLTPRVKRMFEKLLAWRR